MHERSAKHVLLLAMLGMLGLAGCQTAGTPSSTSATAAAPEAKPAATTAAKPAKPAKPELPQGYTCCNFHYEGDWINDANYATLPMIPAGTPAKVTGYGRYRAFVELDGKKYRLGQDYGREQETLQQWTAKMIVAEDPKKKIAGYPASVQEAIKLGRVAVGMTREQVIISVGYPLANENPSLDAPVWRMWISSFGEYQLVWENNRVKEIITDSLTRNLIVHQK